MKRIFILSTLLGGLILIGCNNKPKDLGIVKGKVETYFYADTSYDSESIRIYPKFDRDSIDYRPYLIGIDYEKGYNLENGTQDKEAKWTLNFSVAHSSKYTSVFPTKGILKIDDYEIKYDNVGSSDVDKDQTLLFVYSTENKIEESEIINKISVAKTVKFTAIGNDKKEFIWSPKIVEDAKNTLKYFENLKTTKPTFK
jgi:hypothetical protein